MYGDVSETLVVLSAMLLPIKSPVAFALSWIALFEEVLSASIADGLAWPESFWLYLLLKILFIFLPIFLPYFCQNTQTHSLLQIFNLLIQLNSMSFFICYTSIMTKVMFILSSISSGLVVWSVNHTLMYENSGSKVFKNIKFLDDISSNWPKDLLGTNVWNFVDNYYWR